MTKITADNILLTRFCFCLGYYVSSALFGKASFIFVSQLNLDVMDVGIFFGSVAYNSCPLYVHYEEYYVDIVLFESVKTNKVLNL